MESNIQAITGLIPYEVLKRLNSNYQPTQDYLSTLKGKADTQSIWFEMDNELKKFLAELLNPLRQVSGLRVYLGQYDKSTIPPGTSEPNYLNKLTVGFIATKYVGGKHIDHPDETVEQTNLALDAYNHGKICPPDICPE